MTNKKMESNKPSNIKAKGLSRRQFLGAMGKGAALGALTPLSIRGIPSVFATTGTEQVKKRVLGKTGLMVSEIGIGGHTFTIWNENVTDAQAVEMLASARDIGVNFIDACPPNLEHIIPSKAMKALNARKDFIVSVRHLHINGTPEDKESINKDVDTRLQQWGTDYFDILLVGTLSNDFVDLSYAVEALEKIKEQGKTSFTGFGCHFSRENFMKIIKKYGDFFDVVSLPYNPYHRGAEEVFPAMEEANLGVVTIKPFAAGSLLKDKDLQGKDKDLPQKMLSYVLANKYVDSVLQGFSSVEQGMENFSASWKPLAAAEIKQMEDEYPSKPEIPGSQDSGHDYSRRPPGGPSPDKSDGSSSGSQSPVPHSSSGFGTSIPVQQSHIDWLEDWKLA